MAGLGGLLVAGPLVYNAIVGSGLGVPEWGLLLYGVGLLAAARLLGSGRFQDRVSSFVGWSFPLLLAPLLLYAVNAFLAGPAGLGTADATAPIIHYTLTLPTATILDLAGTASQVSANNIFLATQDGSLTLGVGLVCAGIYPTILFLGILAMHAWTEGLNPRRLTGYLAAGLAGLYVANLFRLVALAKIGQTWGGVALQQAHAHLGWILFVGFMVVFWGLVLRRLEPDAGPAGSHARPRDTGPVGDR